MRLKTKSRWLNLTICGVLLFAVAGGVFGISGWNSQTADVREFSSIRGEWDRVVLGFALSGRLLPGQSPPKPTPPLVGKQRAEADQRLTQEVAETLSRIITRDRSRLGGLTGGHGRAEPSDWLPIPSVAKQSGGTVGGTEMFSVSDTFVSVTRVKTRASRQPLAIRQRCS